MDHILAIPADSFDFLIGFLIAGFHCCRAHLVAVLDDWPCLSLLPIHLVHLFHPD
jgi:hypothetical protein